LDRFPQAVVAFATPECVPPSGLVVICGDDTDEQAGRKAEAD